MTPGELVEGECAHGGTMTDIISFNPVEVPVPLAAADDAKVPRESPVVLVMVV